MRVRMYHWIVCGVVVCCLVTFLYVVMLCGVVFCCSFTVSWSALIQKLKFFFCKSSVLFLGQGTVIVLFFCCVMWLLKRNLVKRCRSLLSVMLLCGLMFCCYVSIRYVVLRDVSRCVTLRCVVFGWVAFDCFSLWCILLWWAVRCCVMVIASCTRNVSAHEKRRMLSVDGSEWVNTFLVFRLVNVAETLAVSPPELLTVGMIYPFSLWLIVSNYNLSREGPYRCEQDGHTVDFRK